MGRFRKNDQLCIYEHTPGLDCGLEVISLFKKKIGDMANFRTGAGNTLDKPRTSCPTRKQRCHQTLLGSCQKNPGATL